MRAPFLMLAASGVAMAQSTSTVMKFSRRLETCDAEDQPIGPVTTRMIYAYSDTTPVDGRPTYHGSNRGTKAVRLTSPVEVFPSDPDLSSFELTVDNLSVPFDDPVTGSDTTYWCKTFEMPTADEIRSHIVAFEPTIEPGNEDVLHHVLVFECDSLRPENGDLDISQHCYSINNPLPDNVKRCDNQNPIGVWAIGGDGFVYPENVGYPLGDDMPKHVLMQVHYNNPTGRDIVDSSGLRFHRTFRLREHEAGIMTIGQIISPDWSIPEQQEAYPWEARCPGECTKHLLPETGINIIGTMLHSHYAGRQMEMNHIRNGRELSPILLDDYYDFNFQDIDRLPTPRVVLPGDELITRCKYNTMDRTAPTPFGFSSVEEMCMTFNVYWPRLERDSAVCNTAEIEFDGNFYNYAQCGSNGTDFFGFEHPDFEPYTPPACERVPPPSGRDTVQPLGSFDPSEYARSEQLDTDGKVTMYWNYDETTGIVDFAVEAEAEGYAAVGISPNGGMVGGDVWMGWVDGQGRPELADRWARAQSTPAVDQLNDLFDMEVGQVRKEKDSNEFVASA